MTIWSILNKKDEKDHDHPINAERWQLRHAAGSSERRHICYQRLQNQPTKLKRRYKGILSCNRGLSKVPNYLYNRTTKYIRFNSTPFNWIVQKKLKTMPWGEVYLSKSSSKLRKTTDSPETETSNSAWGAAPYMLSTSAKSTHKIEATLNRIAWTALIQRHTILQQGVI